MTICHGNGSPESDGCCYVNGAVCPLRWKVVDGSIVAADGSSLGTAKDAAALLVEGEEERARVVAQLQGTTFACRVALEVLATDPILRFRRSAFEAAWDNHADYVDVVRPHWSEVEQQLGLEPGSYQCSTWQGAARPQCCYAESQEENEAKRKALTSSAVAIRKAGE